MAPELEENRTETETTVVAGSQPTYEEIAARAYFRYMERGCVGGSALEDWLAAEAELQRTPVKQTPETPEVTRRRAARGAGEKQRTARTAAKPTRIGRSTRTSPKPAQ